jgi:hypothetical protein
MPDLQGIRACIAIFYETVSKKLLLASSIL